MILVPSDYYIRRIVMTGYYAGWQCGVLCRVAVWGTMQGGGVGYYVGWWCGVLCRVVV